MRCESGDQPIEVIPLVNAKSSLRVVSFNVRSCRGLDRRTDPMRIARIINSFNADLVALQEVASRLGVTGDTRQLDALAKATGLQAIPGPALMRPDAPCGTALLHRLPMLDMQPIDLSRPGREPRGALDVKLNFYGLTVSCISTHLGLRSKERRVQMQTLLQVLAGDRSAVIILAGDINEWWPWSHNFRQIHDCFSDPAPVTPATFPARLPFLKLDRIWLKSNQARITRLQAPKTPLTKIASDHLPLFAEITVTA